MSPRTGGATAYRGPHNPQPDGRCRHRWANRVTRDVHCGYPVGWAEGIAARDAELRAAVMLIEPCCDDMRIGNLRAMCQHGAYVRDSLLALLDQPVVPKP